MQAVQVLLEAKPDSPSYMIGIQENKITKVPLLEAVAQVSCLVMVHYLQLICFQTQAVAAAIENKDFEKAMSYRDSEFNEMLAAFKISSCLHSEDRVSEDKVKPSKNSSIRMADAWRISAFA